MTLSALNQLSDIVAEAGKLIEQTRLRQVAEKDVHDYVTNADLAASRFLVERLPSIVAAPVLTEEDDASWRQHAEATWIVDPLDGTLNFIAGIPIYAVSVALVERGRARLAAVLDVVAGEITLAAAGEGAWCGANQSKLSAPPSPPPVLCLSTGALAEAVRDGRIFETIRRIGKIRNFGAQSLHLAHVARGRAAAAVSEEARLWDDAAGKLLATEAGAHYESFASSNAGPNDPQRSVCCAPAVAAALVETFGAAWRQRH